MIFFFSTWGSFDGVEEHLLANSSHLVDEFLKLSMVVDGSTKKFGLLVRKGDRHGLRFDFARPAPSGPVGFGSDGICCR